MFGFSKNKAKKKKQQDSSAGASGGGDITFAELIKKCEQSHDFVTFKKGVDHPFTLYYYKAMVNPLVIHQILLPQLIQHTDVSLKKLEKLLSLESTVYTNDVQKIQNSILTGSIFICSEHEKGYGILVPAATAEKRTISIPETEFSVIGPKEAFVETIEVNMNMIRKRLPIPELQIKEMRIGKLSKTRVAILFIDGIANKENIETVTQRIEKIEYDHIIDSNYVLQMITDKQTSIFPQLINTERPDRVASVLAEGKIAVLVDGSPSALTGPTTITEFFSSFEDYFLSWHVASFFRLIRLFGVLFSVLSTPLYVAVLTFHYEIIPSDLLGTLIASRSGIPFPPIVEAIILELAIELLREAGARLPSKVGQTIGIVGGIVIGTAAVQAGLTSNVLLIIVALAALASFTTPVYQMSNTIRLLRFPLIIFAQFWGMLGVAICSALLLGHLLRLTSLGRPYLEPIFPLRLADFRDALFRLPFNKQTRRPEHLLTQDPNRLNKQRVNKKDDIDE
ncbi:sopre germination protein [Fictibacillus macauensis ZFHKF-1]|uniref:Sopre germination protein n=1 Tax=Fictibacillus macauensis ZFHKF-1 TaxID=1196324 RepID=I8J3J2_9BACL|nr:spore germination protein [Fictibacillus macauensis]EIT86346.1 sopre germination protein [Fictibacillus macauensis ZFHKF-1]